MAAAEVVLAAAAAAGLAARLAAAAAGVVEAAVPTFEARHFGGAAPTFFTKARSCAASVIARRSSDGISRPWCAIVQCSSTPSDAPWLTPGFDQKYFGFG